MNFKINCPCGSRINRNYYRNHIYSNKHLEFINNNPLKDYYELYNEELFDNLNDKINELDKNNLNMKEGEYINQCNKLLKIYKDNKDKSFHISYRKLIDKLNENYRLYNKIISEITYKNNSIIVYQKYKNIYFNYYLIDDKIIIIKINYLNYILHYFRS